MSKQIRHYAEVISGLALGKLNIANEESETEGFRLIRPQDLAKNSVLYESDLANLDIITPTNQLAERIKEKHYLKKNDIVITARSTNYHVALIKELPNNAKIIMNNNLICIRPNPDLSFPEMILIYLDSNWFLDQVISKEFPKMLSLSVGWVKELEFTMPSRSDCESIAQTATAHRQLIADIDKLKEAANTLLESKLLSASKAAAKGFNYEN